MGGPGVLDPVPVAEQVVVGRKRPQIGLIHPVALVGVGVEIVVVDELQALVQPAVCGVVPDQVAVVVQGQPGQRLGSFRGRADLRELSGAVCGEAAVCRPVEPIEQRVVPAAADGVFTVVPLVKGAQPQGIRLPGKKTLHLRPDIVRLHHRLQRCIPQTGLRRHQRSAGGDAGGKAAFGIALRQQLRIGDVGERIRRPGGPDAAGQKAKGCQSGQTESDQAFHKTPPLGSITKQPGGPGCIGSIWCGGFRWAFRSFAAGTR